MIDSKNPVQVVTTDDWRGCCNQMLERLSIKKPLIFTSRGTNDRLGLSDIFPEANIIDNILPNPNYEQVQAVINDACKLEYDSVLAIGGGSVLDAAKAIKMAAQVHCDDLEKLFVWSESIATEIPMFCIPTTHGTGSEVTPWATIWDTKNCAKRSLSHNSLYPTVAILDAALTKSLPLEQSLITALDALCHSFEALWNKNANETATGFALEAIKLILQNVPLLKENGDVISVRSNLLKAANLGGLAISSTQTAAAHAISYPLTLRFDIPHGLAAALPLLPLIDLNQPFLTNHIQKLLDALNLDSEEALKEQIADIPKPVLKTRLSDFGVSKADLPKIARSGLSAQRMANSAKSLSDLDVLRILEEVF